jgi:3-deoxy-manno-octulosonate cytidylyltransferase (CMP-KDO synthetase)
MHIGAFMQNVLILVPARYGSSRFPGKPLAKINNQSMISYVTENCNQTGFDYAVVTDNDEIESHLKEINADVVRVDDDVTTGSERIYLAYKKYFADKKYDYIINVQGDEPLLVADLLKELVSEHQKNNFDVMTCVKKRSSLDEDFQNPNVVKSIYLPKLKKCLYFTRSNAPFPRDGESIEWYQHIGVYSYKVNALKRFVESTEGELEKIERLEQLRLLENEMTIGAITTNINLIGVDTPEDIHKIEGVLSGKEK